MAAGTSGGSVTGTASGAATTRQKQIPMVSSSVRGPLGAAHLPRLWQKLTLHNAEMLAEGYDYCGKGFDQMTLDALGLDREKTLQFFREKHPTYMEFERWVIEQNGGRIDPERIRKHNEAIAGYNHADDLGAQMRQKSGVTDSNVKDAVTLNTLEDLDDFHQTVHTQAHGHSHSH